eukprot:4997680-Heterocapsa_arctica.AAC.1
MPRLERRWVVPLHTSQVGLAHIRDEPSFSRGGAVWVQLVDPSLWGCDQAFQALRVSVTEEDVSLLGIVPRLFLGLALVGCR